ncbi:hypothetical protein E2C01_011340 [Portunus trituberculatus]|uniref:Uncharacterized protein n=1 Tax=Portunus trituberculatus TaxID=210409 RepID=A0A5B7DAU1_PORTR|nr:hypothetical protein [Portunus trituberculatus]
MLSGSDWWAVPVRDDNIELPSLYYRVLYQSSSEGALLHHGFDREVIVEGSIVCDKAAKATMR